ncbi:MAG: hypothetical protein N3D81_03800 [Spirochaetes bacterium]|nr:hypothetical protein [Spirochaetota bacterium]
MVRFALIFTIISLLLVTSVSVNASESRLVGMNYFNYYNPLGTSSLIEDNFNITYISGYVNSDSNFLVIEPRQGSVGIFDNSYGVVKYSINTPIEKLNIGAIINYPYYELALLTNFVVSLTTTLNDHLRNRIEVLLGVSQILGIKLLRPYLGFGYASDYTNFNISLYQGDTLTNSVNARQSISQIKIILGSIVDLSFIKVDASVKIYLPSYENSYRTNVPQVNNYQNFIEEKSGGAFGLDITAQPRLGLGGTSYLLGIARYFTYSLPASQVIRVDINGDGNLEADTTVNQDYQNVIITAGASFNTYINYILVSLGLSLGIQNSFRKTASGNQEFSTSTSSMYVPIFASFEIPFVDWFLIRGGLSKYIYQNYYSEVNNRQINGTVIDNSLSTPLSSLSLGFSIKPIKDLSLDWVVSYSFLNSVIVNGTLPWILSGATGFNNVTYLFSIEYRIP